MLGKLIRSGEIRPGPTAICGTQIPLPFPQSPTTWPPRERDALLSHWNPNFFKNSCYVIPPRTLGPCEL